MENNVVNNTKRNFLIILVIAFILLVFNVFQLTQNDFISVKKKDLRQKNEQLELAVDAAKFEVNRYKGISAKLDKVVKEANSKLIEQELKINKLLNSNATLKAESKEYAKQILEIKEEYLQTIDSLLLVEGMNIALGTTIESLENEINRLNIKLGVASQFVADNIVVTTLKERLSGELKETALAKQTKAIRVCFDITENKITEKGSYQIYMRIISPEARVLFHSNEDGLLARHPMFKKEVNYSHSESFTYTNEKMSKCILWQVPEILKPGVYVVELFTDENMLSTSTFTIK